MTARPSLTPAERASTVVGMTFGRLTVISGQDVSKLLCRCECGTSRRFRLVDLKRGKIKSCGCLRRSVRTDLTGCEFGGLTVLHLVDREYARGQKMWLARCLCGNEIIVPAKSLVSGNTNSCGCYRSEMSHDRARFAKRDAAGLFLSEAA